MGLNATWRWMDTTTIPRMHPLIRARKGVVFVSRRGSSSGSTCYECVAGYRLSLFNGVNICVFPKSNSQTNTGLIVGVIVFIIVLILIVVTVVLLIRLRKRMDREDAIFCEQNTTLIPDGQGLEYQDSEEP